MVGLGPITRQSIDHHYKATGNIETAKIRAIREYLNCYLKFEEDEIESMEIMETLTAGNGDDISSMQHSRTMTPSKISMSD